MKPRAAAILSIVGVLSAGSAAALVNTKVLETSDATSAQPAPVSSTEAGGTIVVSQPPSSSTTLPTGPSTTVTTVVATAPQTSAPLDTAATTPTSPAIPGPATGVYQLGDGGTVTLSTAGDVLTIVSVDPAPGWSVHESEHEDAYNVEVRLRSDDREVRFEANLLFGVVGTSLRTDDD